MENRTGAHKESVTAHNPVVRATAAASIAWERLWPLAVPAICILLLFLIFSWVGLWRAMPEFARYGALALFAAAFAIALAGLRHFRLPREGEIVRRIETSSRLTDRPLTAQADRLSMGGEDAFSRALWEEHRRRMAGRLTNLSGGAPAPDANRVDPWALRAAVAAVAFAAFGYSLGPQGGRVADAVTPTASREEVLTRLDAWINPPGYTRRPPIFLTGNQAGADGAAIPVPQGSELYLRFVGEGEIGAEFRTADGAVALEQSMPGEGEAAEAAEAAAAPAPVGETEYRYPLQGSGTIAVLSGGEAVQEWAVEIIPDLPPQIRFSEIPSAALSGSLQLSYEVEDDYGVTGANAEISSLIEQDPDARPLVAAPETPLPLPRQRARNGSSRANRDLTEHPWAGSRVSIRLTAVDDAGQTGASAPHEMVLPGRRFSNPLALAILEQRRMLALDANKAPRVADLLDAVTIAPEEFDVPPAAYMSMKIAWRRIVSARDDETLVSAIDLMWEIALAIEFGTVSDAERKLRDAQERLSDALENGASDEEIQRLMDELRQAMNEYMEQMIQEAMRNPMRNGPFEDDPMTRSLRQRDLERMLDQIENLARSGSKDAARQMLSELQRMMDNLRAGRHQQQRNAEGNQMNQALDKLSELMRRQQELMDQTFRMQQRQQQNGENRQGQNRQSQNRQNQNQQGDQQAGEEDKPFLSAEQLRLLLDILGKTAESGQEEKGAAIERKQAISRSIEALRRSMTGRNALDATGLGEVLRGLKGVAEENRRSFGPDRIRRIDELIERLEPAPGDGGSLWLPGTRHGYRIAPGFDARMAIVPVADGEPDPQMLDQLDRLLDDLESDSRSSSRSDRDAIEQLGEVDRQIGELQRRLERPGRPGADELGEMTGDVEGLIRRLTEILRQQQEGEPGAGGEQGGQPQGGQQGGDNSSDMLNRLLSMLLDMQRQSQQGQQGGEQQQGEQGEMSQQELADALRQLQEQQEELRRLLEELGQQLEGMGLDPSQQFGEAGREMGEAGENLGQGNPGGAAGDQGEALEALRRGAQQMMQQMAGDRQQGGEQAGEGRGGRDRERFDPLGREQRAEGLEDSEHTRIPGEIDAQRARDIMEAIRQRLARPDGPVIEKRYLERLLETE